MCLDLIWLCVRNQFLPVFLPYFLLYYCLLLIAPVFCRAMSASYKTERNLFFPLLLSSLSATAASGKQQGVPLWCSRIGIPYPKNFIPIKLTGIQVIPWISNNLTPGLPCRLHLGGAQYKNLKHRLRNKDDNDQNLVTQQRCSTKRRKQTGFQRSVSLASRVHSMGLRSTWHTTLMNNFKTFKFKGEPNRRSTREMRQKINTQQLFHWFHVVVLFVCSCCSFFLPFFLSFVLLVCSKSRFNSHENTTVGAAILYIAVCISDVITRLAFF